MKLSFTPDSNQPDEFLEYLKNAVTFKTSNGTDIPKVKLTKDAYIEAIININEDVVGDSDKEIDFIGLIGQLKCVVVSETKTEKKLE
jgi:hypothetical protein